jgi:hypothetical protein
MNPHPGGTLIFGASSKLGAAVLKNIVETGPADEPVIAACHVSKADFLKRLVPRLAPDAGIIETVFYDPEKPGLGLDAAALQKIGKGISAFYHLDHERNRTLSGSATRRRNLAMCEGVLDLAGKMGHLGALLVVTDIGLAGDYPGRFSEHWIDVGQIPFDEIDHSSIEVETACVAATELPVIRARVGLLSDFFEERISDPSWSRAAEVLLSSIRVFKVLPRFLTIPSVVAKGSLAPLTPVEWAARALVHLAEKPEAIGHAVHLVVSPPPSMEEILENLTSRIGGARLKGGLPVEFVRIIGKLPGLTETARKQADNLASWWTPHRYCLSRNDFDTSLTKSLLSKEMAPPSWSEVEPLFFNI